jgi:hypothetical protein
MLNESPVAALCDTRTIVTNNVLPVTRIIGHVAHMGQRRGAYRVLVSKPEGKGQSGSWNSFEVKHK